jgi:Zn-dependent peptidase ImmA (M78 family)
MYFASLNKAAKEGEEIAKAYEFGEPPVDPFEIVEAERELIHIEGGDFQNAFDGRIKFIGPRFLICYNTKYNAWRHKGKHHTKIIFTVGHELGHFFLHKHREYLVNSRHDHESFTEFTSNNSLIEDQADMFSSGLLMPGYLLRPYVNKKNFVTLDEFHEIRTLFKVSLIGMLVRWTQLTDFPMATVAIKNGKIRYGWVSEALRKRGAYKVRKGEACRGKEAKAFIQSEPSLERYRNATGAGSIHNWIDFDRMRLLTQEFYFAIPYTKTVWVFVMADENELMYSDRD